MILSFSRAVLLILLSSILIVGLKHSVYTILELNPSVSLYDEHQEKTPEEESKEENKEKEEVKDDTFFTEVSSSKISKNLKSPDDSNKGCNSLHHISSFSPPPEC
ncbi:MAG: hypothetical protein ACNS60_05545 [Candidatus Cyclobacteriaceae bacterium M2_1C_046]